MPVQDHNSQMLHQAAAYLQHDHFVPGSQDKYKTASAASFQDIARYCATFVVNQTQAEVERRRRSCTLMSSEQMLQASSGGYRRPMLYKPIWTQLEH